ncbi:WXG100 family type VII secretion target [Amycolatopsis samaneae]|uniref:WXG100 family type VII secretion target n=1 Tax=Amycolatopsis samaneae TaxID=664691 RepID=A0ABW5GGG9_9PSEU
MNAPKFQKTDSGMKGGYQAIQECLDTCKGIGVNVEGIAGELHGEWQGVAAQTFLTNLREWMSDYHRIVNSLDEIGELVGISDQQMNSVEHDIELLSKNAFTGGESDRVFNAIVS